MASKTPIRLKVLKALRRQRHRYSLLRVLSQSISLAILLFVPLSGLAAVDLWGGKHKLLFEEASFRYALVGVIVGIAVMYVVTFLSNVVAGRLFCGWGCPVAQVSRFGEAIDTPGIKRGQKFLGHIKGGGFSVLFVLAIGAWWFDLRMLVSGSYLELLIGWGLTVLGIVFTYLHGRYWRWEFCKRVCPIGLYYSFMAPAEYFGIHFRNEQGSCIECNACDNVCPVNLQPRDLAKAVTDRRGLSLGDAPGFNHCIECGDCIRGCEQMIQLRSPEHYPELVPLEMGYFTGKQRVDFEKSIDNS